MRARIIITIITTITNERGERRCGNAGVQNPAVGDSDQESRLAKRTRERLCAGRRVLALLFMTYIAAARYRSIEASSLSRHARAEAMANIGVNLAILDLLSGISRGATRSARFGSDGTPVFCTLEDGWRLAISVVDEGGKIDLNTANTELIEALIRGMNADGKVAALVAKNIQKLRDDDSFSGKQKASKVFDAVEDEADDEDNYDGDGESDDDDYDI